MKAFAKPFSSACRPCRRRAALKVQAVSVPARSGAEKSNSNSQSHGTLRFGTAIGQGPREELEDAICVAYPPGIDGHLFAAVFDGHGGSRTAQYLEDHCFDFLRTGQSPLACDIGGPHNPINLVQKALNRDRESPAPEDPQAQVFRRALASGSEEELRASLQERFVTLDRRVRSFLATCATQTDRESGSTATVLLIGNNRLAVANVGDSRAVLSRGGEAVVLSGEHRVYGTGPLVAYETARIREGGGWVEQGRVCGVLAVSRAFGDVEFKEEGLEGFLKTGVELGVFSEQFASGIRFTADPVTARPDVTIQPILPQDEFVVIASDGLWDVLGSEQVVKFVRKELSRGKDLDEIASLLVERAIVRQTGDNVSVVIVELGRTYEKIPPLAAQLADDLGSKVNDQWANMKQKFFTFRNE